MATVYQLPSGKWRGQARVKGLSSRSSVFETQTKALRWAQDQEAEMHAYKRTINAGEVSITFADMCREYTTNSTHVRRKETSKRVIERQIKTLLEHLSSKTIQQLDHVAINAYKEKRLTSNSKKRPEKLLSAAKVRLELSTLSAILKLARQRGYTKYNPFDLVERPVPESKIVRIGIEDVTKIVEALSILELDPDYHSNPSYQAAWTFFHMLLALGCRPGELASLEIKNVSFAKRQILFEKTKNTESRTVPVAESDFVLLAEWLLRIKLPDDCPFVFPSKGRKRNWIPYEYYTAWKAVRKLLGHKLPSNITPHSFRHERISRWFEDGSMSDAEIMALSGHKDYKSLQVYTHIRTEKLRQHIEAIRAPESQAVTDQWIKTQQMATNKTSPSEQRETDLKTFIESYKQRLRDAKKNTIKQEGQP